MRQVKLIGKTKKGKERIKQHGELWEVAEGESPAFPGCVLLFSVKKEPGDWRWVHPTNDLNFEMVML